MISIVTGVLGTVLKGLENKLEELKIRRRIETISILKIDQNTGKSSGDPRRIAVTLTSL